MRILATHAPTLHDALIRVAADGWSHVIFDRKLFDTDRHADGAMAQLRQTPPDPGPTAKLAEDGASARARHPGHQHPRHVRR
ncbi:hypothetical protein ACGFI4_14965 [Micromonospora carbonacea]|uniref:hypothetical protein n=1 Tax=Micromonospora carbonacea TaxID=47853 RepID=UPI00372163AB